MISKLDLAPPYRFGEPPTAYASRLAMAHDLLPRELCGDFEIKHWHLINGMEGAIAKIAALGGIDAAALVNYAFVRTGEHDFVYRGQMLRRESLVVGRLDVCPRCLVEDAASAGIAWTDTAYFCRGEWLLDAVDTCRIHRCEMVTIHQAPGTAYCFDFSQLLADKAPRLGEMADKALARDPTALQGYVLTRLDGCETGAPFLDAMPLFAAIRTCEMLGAAACFGRKGKRDALDAERLRAARIRGFEIASRGKEAIEELLGAMTTSHSRRRTTVRDQVVRQAFAALYNYLHVNPKRPTWRVPAFAPLRAVVSDFIKKTFPLKPGDNVLGEIIADRQLHSVTSLAKVVGCGADRVKKVLLFTGLIGKDQAGLANPNIVFDASEGERVLRESITGLPYHGAAKYIGTHNRYQVQQFVDAGLIQPIEDGRLGLRATFAPAALDAFVFKLLKDARPVSRKANCHATVAEAGRKVMCPQVTIVQLILDGRLKWVGTLGPKRDYRSILVNVREVQQLVHGSDGDTIAVSEFAERFNLRKQTAHGLVTRGHVKPIYIARAGHQVARIPFSEVEAFRRRYVTLGELASTLGLPYQTLGAKLTAWGVKPALDKRDVFTNFYLRADVRAYMRHARRCLGE